MNQDWKPYSRVPSTGRAAFSGKGVESFGLYETTMFTWHAEMRRAIRAVGCFKAKKPGVKKAE